MAIPAEDELARQSNALRVRRARLRYVRPLDGPDQWPGPPDFRQPAPVRTGRTILADVSRSLVRPASARPHCNAGASILACSHIAAKTGKPMAMGTQSTVNKAGFPSASRLNAMTSSLWIGSLTKYRQYEIVPR